jgi:hypothetical protein
MTPRFSMTPAELTFKSQKGDITLQMPALHRQTRCLSLIETCGTIWLNGVVLIMRKSFIFS